MDFCFNLAMTSAGEGIRESGGTHGQRRIGARRQARGWRPVDNLVRTTRSLLSGAGCTLALGTDLFPHGPCTALGGGPVKRAGPYCSR
jgi:hypothetical protein